MRRARRCGCRLNSSGIEPPLPALRHLPVVDDWPSSAAAFQSNRQQRRQQWQPQRLVPKLPDQPKPAVNTVDVQANQWSKWQDGQGVKPSSRTPASVPGFASRCNEAREPIPRRLGPQTRRPSIPSILSPAHKRELSSQQEVLAVTPHAKLLIYKSCGVS